jgi:hypothetical protein
MKKPTFLGVKPWLRIERSLERLATIDWAEHPGFIPTNRKISSFNRSNRAFFWEPFPSLRGGMNGKSN